MSTGVTTGCLEGKRIFLLEDDSNTVILAQTLLVRAGAKFKYEMWGDKILRFILGVPVNLVLLDINLPRSDGFTVLQEISALPKLVSIKVVCLTASDDSKVVNKAREAGFDGFISKPFNARTFVDHIRDILDGKPVWIRRGQSDVWQV